MNCAGLSIDGISSVRMAPRLRSDVLCQRDLHKVSTLAALSVQSGGRAAAACMWRRVRRTVPDVRHKALSWPP
jgi:hypothetical protein